MANSYKFKGVALATTNETALLTAASDETIIIRSIRVTNNTSNTPTISIDISDNSASTEYTILDIRRKAYGTLESQLDLLYHDMDADKGTKAGEWFKAVAEVKTALPK